MTPISRTIWSRYSGLAARKARSVYRHPSGPTAHRAAVSSMARFARYPCIARRLGQSNFPAGWRHTGETPQCARLRRSSHKGAGLAPETGRPVVLAYPRADCPGGSGGRLSGALVGLWLAGRRVGLRWGDCGYGGVGRFLGRCASGSMGMSPQGTCWSRRESGTPSLILDARRWVIPPVTSRSRGRCSIRKAGRLFAQQGAGRLPAVPPMTATCAPSVPAVCVARSPGRSRSASQRKSP
ncbi:hypothetical protein D9M72_207980 [compost metagenome]